MTNNAPAHAMSEPVTALLDAFHARTPIRAGSLVVTIFGDAVVPRGGVLSLASLLLITRAFRLGDGVVRTALSRLVADGWFERSKAGRNSFYRLTGDGQRMFADATDRIYKGAGRSWGSRFDAVLLDGDDREAFRAAWAQAGFGQLSGDLMIAPAGGGPSTPVIGDALRFTVDAHDHATALRLAQRAWPLAEIERRYARFVACYAPVAAHMDRHADWSGTEPLVVRILLIHDFRRAVLTDPQLPAALLPATWSGAAARALCGRTYRTVVMAAERWLDAWGESDTGPLPAPGAAFARRFANA